MKKAIFAVILVLSSILSFSQAEEKPLKLKGYRVLGITGSGLFGTGSSNAVLASLSSRFGYNRSRYFQLGARANVGYSYDEFASSNNAIVINENVEIFLGPYFRVQFPINYVMPFMEFGFQIGGNYGIGDRKTTDYARNILLSTGFDFFVKKDIAIEILLDYGNVRELGAGETQFGRSLGFEYDYLAYSIGIIYLF